MSDEKRGDEKLAAWAGPNEKPTVLASLAGKPWSLVFMLNPSVAGGLVIYCFNEQTGEVWENNTGVNFVLRPRRP